MTGWLTPMETIAAATSLLTPASVPAAVMTARASRAAGAEDSWTKHTQKESIAFQRDGARCRLSDEAHCKLRWRDAGIRLRSLARLVNWSELEALTGRWATQRRRI